MSERRWLKKNAGPERVLVALRKAYPGSLTTNQLIEVLYAERADGGPIDAPKLVTRYVRSLREHGHPVISKAHSGYRLDRLQPIQEP